MFKSITLLSLDVLRSLETAGLITQEQDQNNRRNMLVLPAIDTEEYSVDGSGVIDESFF